MGGFLPSAPRPPRCTKRVFCGINRCSSLQRRHLHRAAFTPSPMSTPSPIPPASEATPLTAGVGHYENFPVASCLCPPRPPPAERATSPAARTADDRADGGDARAEERRAERAASRPAPEACLADP